MMLPWVERRFTFDLPESLFPNIIERLRGTAARMQEKAAGKPREALVRRDGERWSFQEHAGHLLDLDALHIGRLDDFLAAAKELRAADMRNRATWEARYNERRFGEILEAFRKERGLFVARLEGWDPGKISAALLHPRLKQPMRLIDMVWFVAEHDDHHLARMTELLRLSEK